MDMRIFKRDLDQIELFNLQLLAEEQNLKEEYYPLFRGFDGVVSTIDLHDHIYDLTNNVDKGSLT